MTYKYRQARRIWSEVLPFGIFFIAWGFTNLGLYLQMDRSVVILPQVASIWQWNIVLFVAAGVAGVVYLTLRLRQQAARLEEVLEAMPCAVLIGGPDKNVEHYNSKAKELIDGGVMDEVRDMKNWQRAEIEICGMRFPGIYTSGGMHLAMREETFPARRGQAAGNVLLFFDVTEWRDATQSTKELADILQDLNRYLNQASDAFAQSMQALAASTVNQALAFQELADYVYRIAGDVELDAREIRGVLNGMTGNIGDRAEEHRKNLDKLNESVHLMNKSHKAAKEAAKQFESLKSIYE